jgi:hypothetical protein
MLTQASNGDDAIYFREEGSLAELRSQGIAGLFPISSSFSEPVPLFANLGAPRLLLFVPPNAIWTSHVGKPFSYLTYFLTMQGGGLQTKASVSQVPLP